MNISLHKHPFGLLNLPFSILSGDVQRACETIHAIQLAGKLQRFESPSAFSIALKRLVNPLRKADDGWKTVKYNGRFLDTYKLELAKRRLAGLLLSI